MKMEVPLFPLHTVLFPGGPLPLRIFEARYLDMVSGCLKQGSGFGVCLIREGREVGPAATTYATGTLARVADWHRRADGLLGITAMGERRFQIRAAQVQPNQLTLAEVELLPEDPPTPLPDGCLHMADVLRRIIAQLGNHYATLPERYDDAGWVGCRLAELLPLSLDQKQYLLQMDDPLQRLERLCGMLQGLEITC
jgi:uncharacterized protein